MKECEKINDMFCDYLNGKISADGKSMVVNHLATCKNCMTEIAALIRIKNIEENKLKPVPAEILNSAFDRIPDKKTAESLWTISFGSVYYSMRIIRQTIRLVTHII